MSSISRIPLKSILPNPNRARSRFDEASIAALAESIRRFGLLSPLLLRRRTADSYELIAGERRLRALQSLCCTHADAIVLHAYDRDCALISLVENLEREDLHFLDIALSCRRILSEDGISREELCAVLGCSTAALSNRLRLLKLGSAVQACIREHGLSERHARALLKLPDAQSQLDFARRAAQQKWSVRHLEAQIEKLPDRKAELPKPRIRDQRLIINAFKDTLQRLGRIGVQAESRLEERETEYDIIITIKK